MADKVSVYKIPLKDWAKISHLAHQMCFENEHSREAGVLEYAYLIGTKETPKAFCTTKHIDKHSVHIEDFGVFKNYRGENTLELFSAVIKHLLTEYEAIFAHIKNDNFPMLALAIKINAKPIGVSVVKNIVYIEFTKER